MNLNKKNNTDLIDKKFNIMILVKNINFNYKIQKMNYYLEKIN
jgi:hypothetical protein